MDDNERKLYVGGLPFRHTKEDLYDMFEKYGKVEDAFIVKNTETQRSRGFGFVTFENEDSLQDAIKALNKTSLDGRELIVEKAGKRRSREGYRRGGGGGGGGGGGFNRGYRDGYRNRDYSGSGGDYRGGNRDYSGGGGRRDYDDDY